MTTPDQLNSPSPALHRVLVYGTLRPGNTPTRLIPGVMYDIGSFPGVRLGEIGRFAVEEIEVDDAGLARLDRYEGYRESDPDYSLYLRRQLPCGSFIYEYNESLTKCPVVECGDWLEYRGETFGRAAGLGHNVLGGL